MNDKDKKTETPIASPNFSVGLDVRQAIRKDAILLLQASDSDGHVMDMVSCLQTTRASLKLKVDKLIELGKHA